jgi:tetratricopeptide (TPR) repeat protein
MNRYAEAEPLLQRSLAIEEMALGSDHPHIAGLLNDLAIIYRAQGKVVEAEQSFKRSLAIFENGPNQDNVSTELNNLANLYFSEGRYADALALVKRTINDNRVQRSIALKVLYTSVLKNVLVSSEGVELSSIIFQHTHSSAAEKAVSTLAARFAAGSNELAQLVRKDQDLGAEASRLDKGLIAAVSKGPYVTPRYRRQAVHRGRASQSRPAHRLF